MKKIGNRMTASLLAVFCFISGVVILGMPVVADAALTYEIVDDVAVITGTTSNEDAIDLVIPSSIDGYDVKKIGDYAFSTSGIKSLMIEEGVESIGSYAFSECKALESVQLPESLETLENCAFSFCTSLTEFKCPSGLVQIGSSVFSYCTALENLYLNEGLEEIGGMAISNCSALQTVIIPSTVKTISFGDLLPAIEYCEALETIELKCDYTDPLIFVADCPNLKTVIFSGDIGTFDVSAGAFLYNFYACEPRAKMVNARTYTVPLDITIQGKKGTIIEQFTMENGFDFVELEAENTTGSVDISEYTESDNYHVEKIIPTQYGTVLYYWPVGVPHSGKNPSLTLVKEDGSKVYLSTVVSREDLWHYPEHENIALSEDGKTLTFSASFEERNESFSVADGEPFVLHDAGTYYYKADLETGSVVETKFEPFDTISEDIISTWAKAEVDKAIGLGIVPLSFRENFKRNITRSEFAKLAMYFLSVQYGYAGAPMQQYWSPLELSDNLDMSSFMNAYCSVKTDRNGNSFRDAYDEEDYIYHNTNVEIKLPDLPFADVDENDINSNISFVERAYHIGIVNGISETEFDPTGDITRQEAAAMLVRVYKNYAEYDDASNEFEFSDHEQIADWAKEDVYYINALGVMQGVGDDAFAPLAGYTIEQAIVTFWRLYDSAPVSRKNKNITPLLDYQFESKQYFHREGGSYFHETLREEYENFILVYGYWTQRHTTATFKNLCVFDKFGGLVCDVDAAVEWGVSQDEKILTVLHHCGDTFRLYNKLNGTEKVYDKGVYQLTYDIEGSELINFERIS